MQQNCAKLNLRIDYGLVQCSKEGCKQDLLLGEGVVLKIPPKVAVKTMSLTHCDNTGGGRSDDNRIAETWGMNTAYLSTYSNYSAIGE